MESSLKVEGNPTTYKSVNPEAGTLSQERKLTKKENDGERITPTDSVKTVKIGQKYGGIIRFTHK
jgi:hypothetical protein